MPSKTTNTYFKDKLLIVTSILAMLMALLALLGDYWWEDASSTQLVDLGLWVSVTCGQILLGVGTYSTYACFRDDQDSNGWVKFVRITSAFATSLICLSLMVHSVYLLRKSPVLKTFSSGAMFIAGLLFFIVTCVVFDRFRNLTEGYNAVLFYPKNSVLRPHYLPVMFVGFAFLFSQISAVGLMINPGTRSCSGRPACKPRRSVLYNTRLYLEKQCINMLCRPVDC